MTAFLLFVMGCALSFEAQTPPRDVGPAVAPAAAPAVATINGRVLIAATRQPARNAVVLLRPKNSNVEPVPAAVTDIDGRFTVSNVAAGAYTLSTFKTAYLPAHFKPDADGTTGSTFELRPGDVLDAGLLELRKGGVITGRVVHESGEPAFVEVAARWHTLEHASTGESPITVSDDRGQFRLYGLEPGRYIVSAHQGTSPALGDDAAPTYYPGTAWISDARSVTVDADRVAGGIDIVLQMVRKVRVKGRVADSHGAPLEYGNLLLEVNHRSAYLSSARDVGLDAEGRFNLSDVDPGEYLGTVIGRTREGVTDPPEAAIFFMKVTGEPIGDIAITTRPAVTAFGTVRFDGGGAPGGAVLVAEGAKRTALETTRFEWKPDGSFQLRGLYGRLSLRWTNVPSGWTLKEMRLAGRDVTSEALDFVPGTPPVGPLEVVFARR